MIYTTYYVSPIGKLLLAARDEQLIGLWIEGQKYYGSSLKEKHVEREDLLIFKKAKNWLDRYFNGEHPSPEDLKLAPMGTAFQQAVWQILIEIPYGKTVTYGEIACELAKRRGLKTMSSRAVGSAVGHNPISIIIPCHRVIGVKGLTGYAGGIPRKRYLLEREGVL